MEKELEFEVLYNAYILCLNGKSDCYFLKIDLSGYFMSIDRKQEILQSWLFRCD